MALSTAASFFWLPGQIASAGEVRGIPLRIPPRPDTSGDSQKELKSHFCQSSQSSRKICPSEKSPPPQSGSDKQIQFCTKDDFLANFNACSVVKGVQLERSFYCLSCRTFHLPAHMRAREEASIFCGPLSLGLKCRFMVGRRMITTQT